MKTIEWTPEHNYVDLKQLIALRIEPKYDGSIRVYLEERIPRHAMTISEYCAARRQLEEIYQSIIEDEPYDDNDRYYWECVCALVESAMENYSVNTPTN